jgi:hypothetical protein
MFWFIEGPSAAGYVKNCQDHHHHQQQQQQQVGLFINDFM